MTGIAFCELIDRECKNQETTIEQHALTTLKEKLAEYKQLQQEFLLPHLLYYLNLSPLQLPRI